MRAEFRDFFPLRGELPHMHLLPAQLQLLPSGVPGGAPHRDAPLIAQACLQCRGAAPAAEMSTAQWDVRSEVAMITAVVSGEAINNVCRQRVGALPNEPRGEGAQACLAGLHCLRR